MVQYYLSIIVSLEDKAMSRKSISFTDSNAGWLKQMGVVANCIICRTNFCMTSP